MGLNQEPNLSGYDLEKASRGWRAVRTKSQAHGPREKLLAGVSISREGPVDPEGDPPPHLRTGRGKDPCKGG